MEILDSEKRRARNLIWNAAADYSFEPDFKAYDEDGRADLYWNSIIGAVRKNYGAETIEGLFESLHGCSKEQLFEQLLWLGLENAVYQREAPRRPALPSLRRSYARRAVALDQRADPGDLLATLENAHFCRALGQSEPPLLPRDREMLDALEFPGDLDGPAIAERALAFLHTYFHFTPGETQAQESEERKRRRPLFAFRRRSEADLLPAVRAFGHGFGEHLVKGQGGGANAEPVQRRLTDYNLAQTEAALRKYMRGYFGAPLYDQSQLESLERELCVDEHQGCHLYYATGDDTLKSSRAMWPPSGATPCDRLELNLGRPTKPTPPATAPASAASPPASATPCWLISSPPLSVPPPARWMPAASGGACTWTTTRCSPVFSSRIPATCRWTFFWMPPAPRSTGRRWWPPKAI